MRVCVDAYVCVCRVPACVRRACARSRDHAAMLSPRLAHTRRAAPSARPRAPARAQEPAPNGFNLLARAGRQVQELCVETTLGKDAVREAVKDATAAVKAGGA